MKAVLKFNLDDMDDAEKHRRCVNATNAYLALYKIREYIGDECSHLEICEATLEGVIDIMNEYSVDLDNDLS